MGSAATSRTRIVSGLLMVACAALSAAGATRTPAVEEIKDISGALSMIGADEFAQREKATDYLLRAPADALPQVEKRLEHEKNPETIERLSRVALHLFMKEKTTFEGKAGFMGIAFSLEYEARGKFGSELPVIVVIEMLPGFPSAEYLKAGDRIVGIDGTEFPAEFRDTDFREIISNKKPGTKITMMVERGKDKINASVPLAGIKDLDLMSMADFKNVRESIAQKYLGELKHEGDKPIDIPFDIDPSRQWDIYMTPQRKLEEEK